MIRTIITGRGVALALVATLAATMPAIAQSDDGLNPQRRLPPGQAVPPPAQPQPQHKKHHDSGVGAAIGAGLVGGLVGGALLGGQRQAQPGYAPQPAYAPPPPPPPAYEVEDEPECRIVRKPVYDEDGEIVDYKQRRICR